MKVAVWIIAGSLAVIATVAVLPFFNGMQSSHNDEAARRAAYAAVAAELDR